jgi:hypothetical protein
MEPLGRALAALAALLAAMTLYVIARSEMGTTLARSAIVQALDQQQSDANDVSAGMTTAKSAAEELKRKNLFIPAPPKENPVKEVAGILGDEAWINGKWCKVGDSVGDAKIVAIEPTLVKVLWEGQEQEFKPIGSSGAGGNGPPGGPPRPSGGPGPSPARVERPMPQGGPPSGRPPGGMSPEEMAALRERMQKASPEERQKIAEEMRARMQAGG